MDRVEIETTTMSTSNTSATEVSLKLLAFAMTEIVNMAKENSLIESWYRSHDLPCALAIGYVMGYVEITTLGEKSMRQAFGVLAEALEISDMELALTVVEPEG